MLTLLFPINLHFHLSILEHLTCTILCFVYGLEIALKEQKVCHLCLQIIVSTVLSALNALTYSVLTIP